MNKRLSWIDNARGLGIILVVYGHVLDGLVNTGLNLNKMFYHISYGVVYGFHMPLFFFLSGFFAERWITKDFKSAIGDKIKIILYPYIIWSAIQSVFKIMVANLTNTKMQWADLLKVFYDPIGQFWFLYALFFIFLIYYLLRKKINLVQLAIISVILYFIPYFYPALTKNALIIARIMHEFIYFAAGALFATKINYEPIIEKLYKTRYFIFSFFSFVLSNILYLSFSSKLNDAFNAALQFIIAVIGIIFIISLSCRIERYKISGFINYLGILSIVIYSAHIISMSSTRIILLKLLHVDNLFIHGIVGTVAGIMLPVMFYLIIKKFALVPIFFGKNIERVK